MKALVERSEEHGFIEAPTSRRSALEHELNEEDRAAPRELETIGLEIAPKPDADGEGREAGRGQEASTRPARLRRRRQPAALPRRRRPPQAAHRRRRGHAREADRARRPGRQAPHDRVEPPARRVDRQGLPRARRAVPRPDPGGDAGPEPRGREVRLAPRLQVLDVRDLVDPPVGAARRREPRAHDPRARPRRRAPAEAVARPRAGSRSSSAARRRRRSSRRRPASRSSTSTRRSAPRTRRSRSTRRSARTTRASSATCSPTARPPIRSTRPRSRCAARAYAEALDALPERERRILELRFGFEGEPWTLEAIGHELDLTRERVRQLEGQALSALGALRDLISVSRPSARPRRPS